MFGSCTGLLCELHPSVNGADILHEIVQRYCDGKDLHTVKEH